MGTFHEGASTFRVWFAYTLAVGATLFFGMFVVGEGIPGILHGHGKGLLLFLPWLFLAMIGCILSFFKRKTGSLMMLIGGITMAVTFLLHGLKDLNMAIAYGVPYIIAGLFLFIPEKK
jgi:hypothetical protein